MIPRESWARLDELLDAALDRPAEECVGYRGCPTAAASSSRRPPGASGRDYPHGEGLHVVDRVTRRSQEVLAIPEATLAYPTVSPKGDWILFVRSELKADIWTL